MSTHASDCIKCSNCKKITVGERIILNVLSVSSVAVEGSTAASSQRLRVKGGAVVDPASGLEDRASVARDPQGRPLSAVLGMVDLVRGSNSYYK